MPLKSNTMSLIRRILPVPPSRTITLEQDGKAVRLLAPPDHMLDRYRATFPLYDRQLPRIALAVEKAGPGELFIDVGANIGDTVALLRLAGCRNPILAVEPSDRFLAFASRNVGTFTDVELRQAFVGPGEARLALDEQRGTASSIQMAAAQEPQIPTVELGSLTERRTALIKTDTDGFDAKVLASGLDFLEAERPLIWSEAEVHSAADVKEWIDVLKALPKCYSHVIAFDNFGFPVVYGALESTVPTLRDLLEYCRRHAAVPAARGGEPRIYYLDVALFPERLMAVYADAVTGFEREWA